MPEPTVTPEPTTPAAPVEGVPAEGEEKKAAAAEAPKTGDPVGDKIAKEAIRRLKVKVDGEEREVEEEEVVKGFQLSQTAYKRLEEVQTLKKQLEGFVSDFKADPVKVLRALAGAEGGQGFRDAVEKFLYDEMQAEKLSPEQKKLREYESKLKEAEEAKQRAAAQEQARKDQAAQEHWAREYDKAITEALNDPSVGLPKTPRTVGRMAELMAKSLRMGIEVAPRDVAKLVRQEIVATQKEVLGKLDGKALMDLLGQDVAKRIRQYEVDSLKRSGKPPIPSAPSPAVPAADDAKARSRITERDFDARLKAIREGKA